MVDVACTMVDVAGTMVDMSYTMVDNVYQYTMDTIIYSISAHNVCEDPGGVIYLHKSIHV